MLGSPEKEMDKDKEDEKTKKSKLKSKQKKSRRKTTSPLFDGTVSRSIPTRQKSFHDFPRSRRFSIIGQIKSLTISEPPPLIAELPVQLNFENIAKAKEELSTLSKKIDTLLLAKVEKISSHDNLPIKEDSLSNILLALCFMNQNPAFDSLQQTTVRELLAGLFASYNSIELINTLLAIYPNIKLNNIKLNVIFVVKELIILDDFYHNILKEEFRNKFKEFRNIIKSDFKNIEHKMGALYGAKRIMLQPWEKGYYDLTSFFARTSRSKGQKNIFEILLNTGREKAASVLAHDLTLITLAFCQTLPILEFTATAIDISTPKLLEFKNFMDRIANFLVGVLLKQRDLETRKRVMSIYILTIQKLLWPKNGLCDFNSALILHSCIFSGDAGRLKKTSSALDNDIVEIYKKVEEVLNCCGNYRGLRRLIEEQDLTLYLPIIANQNRAALNARHNEHWPDRFTAPGKVYLDILEQSNSLRDASIFKDPRCPIISKSNLLEALDKWIMEDDDTFYLKSLSLEFAKLTLDEAQYYCSETGCYDFSILQKTIAIYAKYNHPLIIIYKAPADTNDTADAASTTDTADKSFILKEAKINDAIILLYNWLKNLVIARKIDYAQAFQIFQQAGELVNSSMIHKKCLIKFEEFKVHTVDLKEESENREIFLPYYSEHRRKNGSKIESRIHRKDSNNKLTMG